LIGEQKHLYFPPTVNAENFGVITEGEKKAIVATGFGFPTIGVSGVECFNTVEMKEMRLVDREIYICYDREQDNPQVSRAENRLKNLLIHKKAKAKIIDLPMGYKLDEFLLEQGPDEFTKLVEVAK
jgi:DNA primase